MKKNSIFALIVLIATIFSAPINAWETSKIVGFIIDNKTSKPIPDANVFIENTNFGAASQPNGYYFIEKVARGNQTITVRVIGYESKSATVTIEEKDTRLDFRLEPKPIQFDPVIVTATMSEHRQSQVTAATEVLTAEQLSQQTAITAAEAMESIAGLYIKNYDGFAGVLSPSIRGANTNQVVVLLDGMRLNTAQGGGVDLNAFPVSALDRVEIVRGGHSALTGADAVGGAIQLISRETLTPAGISYGVKSTFGSFGTQNFNLFGAQQFGFFSYFINFNHLQSEGNFEYQTPASTEKLVRKNNDYKANNLFVKARLNFNEKNKLQLIYHDMQNKKGVAGSVNLNPWTGAPMLTPNASAKNDRKMASIFAENQIFDRLRIQEQFYYQIFKFNYTDPDDWVPVDDTHKNGAFGLNLRAAWQVNAAISITTGAELRRDRLESTKFNRKQRNTRGLFAQVEFRHSANVSGIATRWVLIPAIRWDSYSDVNSHTSPKLGWSASVGDELSLTIRGNVGTSYRAPSFDDLYWPDDGWTRGNPDLAPETSTNFDGGFVLQKNGTGLLQLEMSYFRNDIHDLIGWAPDNDGVWTPLNTSAALISGVESGVKYSLPGNIADVKIFHTWMKATDETNRSSDKGNWLIYRPEHKLDILTGVRLGGFSTNLNLRLVGKRYIAADNSNSLPKYHLLNGNLSYHFDLASVGSSITLQALNLLNKSVYLNDGYPLPGREFRLTIGVEN
ncbi:MAG: TonB-dependent receptor [bacterium]|nr:TonB-dependent receptor [bacterium]